ncbi:palmitoyltransferase ZDHHC6 isoform X1 [Macrosteles quadrilineatus]|uniref:palmitoyltransferase ZDHHC6 isoform X1 n=1 Tax=Macrosteles quadrilineatus TaxID=74068 RepID=UPI0023E15768|nr:palmitoyltransferase ZDHHC6 isoform X1 [Macrosteles quadrilineatus]XP_054263651.1 palmitoyltransferase ZDHHC6 isoform X1 [Macrosteles quadrilineatus]
MCFGPLKRMCHWGPIAAFVIIKLVTLMTIHACNMWWPPYNSVGGFINKAVFLLFSGLTLYNLITAIFEGPGYVPLKWVPEDVRDEAYLQFCKTCQGYKAPRAHHCRKCGRCVMKMDHHCPWINNCVGHQNHLHFTSFLLCAVIGCAQSTVILSCTLYRGFYRMWYLYHGIEPLVTFNIYSLVFTVFALGLSIGVVLAVGMLFYFQMRAILRNRTGIEDWIVEKAIHRRRPDDSSFVYPYDLGWKKNFTQVFSWGGVNRGDGITWPVVEGCHQYSLTIEQKEQKGEKRQRTRAYSVVYRYSGRWLPVVHGWRTCCNIPFTDEARITLEPGDSVLVTRWRRYWLFGERSSSDGSKARGWFPRCCVVEISACPDNADFPQNASTKKTQ